MGSGMVWLTLLGGCSAGVPGGSTSLTFGPVGNSSTPTSDASGTVGIDPTTGGLGGTTGGEVTGRPDDTGPVDASSTSGSSSGPGNAVCGDGVADPGEDCDGVDLAGLDCVGVDPMFTGGTLACDAGCTFDTSGCSAAQNPIQLCQAVNAAIPDADPTGVTNTIVLPPEFLGGTITDVDVEVELVHTYIGDLVIDVTHAGTSVVLHDSCFGDIDLHVTYDDRAGAVFDCAMSDQGLTVQPFGTLANLDGVPVGASWTLFVEDQVGADVGTLVQWCVTISWI